MPTMKELLARADSAVCGISEKEVTVATKNLEASINKLKKGGFYIVGTSYHKGPTKKIWFTRPGSL